MVSCERTVRSGGGLLKKDRDSFQSDDGMQFCIVLMQTGPRRSGRAQETTRGGAWDRVLYRAIENLACLWQLSSSDEKN